MSKRTAADSEQVEQALKSGQRPAVTEDDGDAPEFEDEFEDEFESEDEIMAVSYTHLTLPTIYSV